MPRFLLSFLLTLIIFLFQASPSAAQTTPSPTVHTPKVFVIGIDPTDATGASLANTYFKTAMEGKPAAEFELFHAQQTINDFKELSQGQIQYILAGHTRITTFPTYPNGFNFTVQNYSKCVWGRPEFDPTFCETQKNQFQYVQFFQEHQICQKAAAVGADEIWVYSPPYILAYEDFMVGPNAGFRVNGPDFTVPGCDKHLIVVNAVYDTPNNMLHSYGHRVESTIEYLMRNFKEEDRQKYWGRFSGFYPGGAEAIRPLCGNTHFPFNFRYGYDVGNTAVGTSSCADFANFPDYTGTSTEASCSSWGCTDRGWQKYWFSYIPRKSGTHTITDINGKTYQFKKDWWFYLLYPENALRSESYVEPSPTPSPSPSVPPECAGDINEDGEVDLIDYSRLVFSFMKTPIPFPRADIHVDGEVNLTDYSIFVNKFLKPC